MNQKYGGRVNILFNILYDRLRHITLITAYSTFNLHLHYREFKYTQAWFVELSGYKLYFFGWGSGDGENILNILNKPDSPKIIIIVTVRIF